MKASFFSAEPLLALLLGVEAFSTAADPDRLLAAPYPDGFSEYARQFGTVKSDERLGSALQGEAFSQVFNREARLPGNYFETVSNPFERYGQKESDYLFPGTGSYWQQVRITVGRPKEGIFPDAWSSAEALSRALTFSEMVPGYPSYPAGYITARHDSSSDVWQFELPSQGEIWVIGRQGLWLFSIKGYGSSSNVLKERDESLPKRPLTPPPGYKLTERTVFSVDNSALLQANRDACNAFAHLARAQLSAPTSGSTRVPGGVADPKGGVINTDGGDQMTLPAAGDALKMSVKLIPVAIICDFDKDGQITSSDARLLSAVGRDTIGSRSVGSLDRVDAAHKFVKAGYGLEKEGRLVEAMRKYEESLEMSWDERVAQHNRELKVKAAEKAQQLVNEGYALEQQGRLTEALSNYSGAHALLPEPGLAKKINQIKSTESKK